MSVEPAEEFAAIRRIGANVPRMDPGARARALVRLDREIELEVTTRRRRRRVATLLAAALAVLAVTSLLELGFERPGGEELPILQIAAVAGAQSSPSIPDGSFMYTRSLARAWRTDVPVDDPEQAETTTDSWVREVWIAEDGSGLIVETRDGERLGRTLADPGDLRFAELNSAPTDPDGLLAAIMGEGYLDEPDSDVEILAGIAPLLGDAYALPEHRRALFEIVAALPGVTVDERHEDRAGRVGTAVSLGDGRVTVTLVFDPETSGLLEFRQEYADGRISAETYLQTALVGETGERPRG
jgi:hypothetical protein